MKRLTLTPLALGLGAALVALSGCVAYPADYGHHREYRDADRPVYRDDDRRDHDRDRERERDRDRRGYWHDQDDYNYPR